ncbi:HAD-IC family P-type ATPase [Sinomonas sp. ASV322]|uniref:HAD-IC family P-type ATPase n=1 Tax=Sinomonas sp. ASV322 TaxID=3041920 RepID=UPI0027DE9BF0|nr:HAD-IC family P-type ATPase [Sinomonas sp. ASV322]MDQ4503730.1 HAD-IC family P-type ATPase [Sinomonas sp. ASV322]
MGNEVGTSSTIVERGLSADEVARRVADGATNDVPPRASRGTWEIVRANVFTRINAIFAVLAAIIFSTGYLLDGLFAGLIVANSVVGIVQELRAKRTLDRLAIVGQARPRVRRDGRSETIPPHEIVLDDVIELGPGDQIVVDGQVLAADSLEIDESLLTGESDPIMKGPDSTVLSGSFVVSGTGLYRATKVGREAYAAQLEDEASKFTLVNSELRNGINTILKVITWLLVPAGILSVFNQLTGRQPLPDALRGMVAALVPMVPEGLILMTTIAFAVGVVRLGRRNCLVNELSAIEGLARVDVVCADKTGTLTENAMELAEVRPVAAPANDGAAHLALATQALSALAAADPRPNASLQAIAEAFPASPGWRIGTTLPFSSARKYGGASFDGHGTWLLGAPDVLLPAGAAARDEAEALGSRGVRVLLLARAERLAAGGLTGLGGGPAGAGSAAGGLTGLGGGPAGAGSAADGLPHGPGGGPAGAGSTAAGLPHGLGEASSAVVGPAEPGVDPVALVVLEQKVRDDARATLDYFAAQRVAVKVISGDNAASVGAVAGHLGLPGAGTPVDARDLPNDDAQLAGVVDDRAVFGRVSPAQKRSMVRALRSRGHTVAMTGDGVNDVLALKDADIGVAMGAGSPATRAVAQIVLLDNKFATLPHVVGEGRRVIGNIERVANLFLTKTVYSVLLALMVGVPGLIGLDALPYPFLPRHVTITGWFTIGLPAFILSLAPNHDRAQPGFVGRVMRMAIPAGVVIAVASFTCYLVVRPSVASGDATQVQASTSALMTLIAIALWVLAIVARPYEWWKVLLVGAMMAASFAMFALPLTQRLFELDPGSATSTSAALVCAAVGIAVIELGWWVDGWLRRAKATRA